MMILFWGAGAQLQAQACVSCLLVMPQNTFTDKKEKNANVRIRKTTPLLNLRAFPHKPTKAEDSLVKFCQAS